MSTQDSNAINQPKPDTQGYDASHKEDSDTQDCSASRKEDLDSQECSASHMEVPEIQAYIASHKEELGIHEYAFLSTSDLVFSQEVRHLCEVNSCGQYGTTWACPPGVGTLEECKNKILKYKHLFVFTTLHELEDSYDFEGMMDGKDRHNELCPSIAKIFQDEYKNLLILSAEGCNRCKTCTYPDAPCRFPDTLYPSIESHCVEVNRLAATAGIHYINGENTVTYFGCIMY